MSTDLDRVLTGEPPERQEHQFRGVLDALVTRATLTELHFVIPEFDPQLEFGPAPYPRIPQATATAAGPALHDHAIVGEGDPGHPALAPLLPPEGTRCLVAFVDGDPDRPRVLATYGWPA